MLSWDLQSKSIKTVYYDATEQLLGILSRRGSLRVFKCSDQALIDRMVQQEKPGNFFELVVAPEVGPPLPWLSLRRLRFTRKVKHDDTPQA